MTAKNDEEEHAEEEDYEEMISVFLGSRFQLQVEIFG